MTNREFVADVWNSTKSFSSELFISPKWVLDKAIDIAGDFIKKDSDTRRLWKMKEPWTELECFPMIEVPLSECPSLDTYECKILMRSKHRVPGIFDSRYGNLIKSVASVNFQSFYDPVSPRQFNAIMKREFVDYRKRYYFFIDNYLYIPNSQVELIRVEAMFKKPWEVYRLNHSNEECISCMPDCKSPLDFEFACPEFLLNNVKQELFKQLKEVYLQLHGDTYPNIKPEDKQEEKTAGKKNG